MAASVFANAGLKRNVTDQPSVKAEEALAGKVVAVYFSAHWCPPCRAFTPTLKEFYEEVKDAGKNLEIVFVSLDRSEADLKAYLEEAHGEWLYVYGDAAKELASKFSVSGIPALIILNKDGADAGVNGRGDVSSKGPTVFDEWQKAAGL